MTKPTTPQLSEAEVYDLESSLLLAVDGKAVVRVDHAAALIRDWRALRAQVDEWESHREGLIELFTTAEARVSDLESQNAALREQVAQQAEALRAIQNCKNLKCENCANLLRATLKEGKAAAEAHWREYLFSRLGKSGRSRS